MGFEEYERKLEWSSANLRSDASTLALMLLYVERQLPSCIALERRIGVSLKVLFTSINQLWIQVLSQTLASDQLTAMREEILNLASISDVAEARSALPTVAVALNTCDAVLKIIDFLVLRRGDSFVLCAMNCLDAVRDQVHREKYFDLVAAKGFDWIVANRNSIEYANAMEHIAQAASSDTRTHAEIAAQLSFAEVVLRIPSDDRAALLETRKIALPGRVNSLGFAMGHDC